MKSGIGIQLVEPLLSLQKPWGQSLALQEALKVTCLPSQHSRGRQEV